MARSLAFIVAAGVLSMGWSELAWGLASPQDHRPSTLLFLLVAYTVIAGILTWTIRTFKVSAFWSLILAAAVFGWLAEGAVAATMLPLFPAGIVWTAIAWHGLLTVVGGWWLLPKFLRSASLPQAAMLGALLGLGLGIWAINSLEPKQFVRPQYVYAQLAVLTTLVAVVYPVFDRLRPGGAPLAGRLLPSLLAAVLAAWFAFAVVPSQPLAPVLLIPLVVGALVLLRIHRVRHARSGADLLSDGSRLSPTTSTAFALVMGAVAASLYGLAQQMGWRMDSGLIAFAVLSLLGVVALAVAVVQVVRPPASGATDAA